jgi:hypothetical protein
LGLATVALTTSTDKLRPNAEQLLVTHRWH